MKPSPSLLAIGSLVAVLSPATVRAEEFALNFSLPTVPDSVKHPLVPGDLSQQQNQFKLPLEEVRPLPVPPLGVNPPMRYHSPQQLPKGVYRQAVAVALTQERTALALLPPAPPSLAEGSGVAPLPILPESAGASPVVTAPGAIALSFDLSPPSFPSLVPVPQSFELALNSWSSWFLGDSDSLVARAIGNAEGTRTATGGLTRAYYGHRDPGNQVWNLGTFSYQHGADSPGEADQRQLKRLKSQVQILQKRALKHGLTLSLEETLNALDLANQSPLAAIGRVGYVERLAEAKANGHSGIEAIVVARTRSYINPQTQRWNAPGLGNTETSIRQDQERRARAVGKALAAYRGQHPGVDGQVAVLGPGAVAIASPTPSRIISTDHLAESNQALSFNLEVTPIPDVTLTASLPLTHSVIHSEPEKTNSRVSSDHPQVKTTPASDQLAWNQVREAYQSPLGNESTSPQKNHATAPSPTSAPTDLTQSPLSTTTNLSQAIGALPETVIHLPSSAPTLSSSDQAVHREDRIVRPREPETSLTSNPVVVL